MLLVCCGSLFEGAKIQAFGAGGVTSFWRRFTSGSDRPELVFKGGVEDANPVPFASTGPASIRNTARGRRAKRFMGVFVYRKGPAATPHPTLTLVKNASTLRDALSDTA